MAKTSVNLKSSPIAKYTDTMCCRRVDIFCVNLFTKAERDLKKVPLYIVGKFQLWLDLVESEELREARKIQSR